VLLTARNIFIANLAISDLLLCSFTMPLAMLDIITKFWVLGPSMVNIYILIAYCVVFLFISWKSSARLDLQRIAWSDVIILISFE
jgi:hypothetical protein